MEVASARARRIAAERIDRIHDDGITRPHRVTIAC
jgi:hypothetical protein